MDSQKKKIAILILLILVFIIIFFIFVLFLQGKLFHRKSITNNQEKIYLNIDKNKKIENPKTEDLQNLINQIKNDQSLDSID